MAAVRDSLLHRAAPQGAQAVAQLRTELDELGPSGLWRETVRYHLQEHGFVQEGQESFAEMVSRALGISLRDFRMHMAQGRLGGLLQDRFKGTE